MRVLFQAFCLLLISFPGIAAEIFGWRDANGVMNYSDSPPVGGAAGEVRTIRVGPSVASEGGSSAQSSAQAVENARQSGPTASGNAGGRALSENRGAAPSGGAVEGAGLAGGQPSGGGTPSAGGSVREGGGEPVATGSRPTSDRPTAASSAPNRPATPVSTAPAPDQAVPISTATAPDRSVPISTTPVPDEAVPISTPPAPDRAVPVSTAPTADQAVPVSSGPGPDQGTPVSNPPRAPARGGTASTSGTPGGGASGQGAGGTPATAQATLYWDEVTKPPISKIPVAGYRVYFGEGPGAYLQPRGQGVNAGNVTSYTVQGLKSGTRYYFTVTTYVGGSESPYANEVSKVATAP